MNKEKFNKLKIEDQVKYINLEIKTKEFEKVCKSVGSNKSLFCKWRLDRKIQNEPFERAANSLYFARSGRQ